MARQQTWIISGLQYARVIFSTSLTILKTINKKYVKNNNFLTSGN